MHDGSQMRLTISPADQTLELRYTDPPAQLREIGVAPDTVLVRGHWVGAVLEGEAFVFSSNCQPIPYPVRGLVDLNSALVILGPVPMVNADCEVTRSAWDERSVMRFDPLRTAAPAARRKPKEKPKAKPKPRPRSIPSVPQQQPYQQQPWRWF